MSEIPLWGFERLPISVYSMYMGEGEKGGRMHFNGFSKIEVRCMNVELTLQLNLVTKIYKYSKTEVKISKSCPQPAS
jgi:hypothetical protein